MEKTIKRPSQLPYWQRSRVQVEMAGYALVSFWWTGELNFQILIEEKNIDWSGRVFNMFADPRNIYWTSSDQNYDCQFRVNFKSENDMKEFLAEFRVLTSIRYLNSDKAQMSSPRTQTNKSAFVMDGAIMKLYITEDGATLKAFSPLKDECRNKCLKSSNDSIDTCQHPEETEERKESCISDSSAGNDVSDEKSLLETSNTDLKASERHVSSIDLLNSDTKGKKKLYSIDNTEDSTDSEERPQGSQKISLSSSSHLSELTSGNVDIDSETVHKKSVILNNKTRKSTDPKLGGQSLQGAGDSIDSSQNPTFYPAMKKLKDYDALIEASIAEEKPICSKKENKISEHQAFIDNITMTEDKQTKKITDALSFKLVELHRRKKFRICTSLMRMKKQKIKSKYKGRFRGRMFIIDRIPLQNARANTLEYSFYEKRGSEESVQNPEQFDLRKCSKTFVPSFKSDNLDIDICPRDDDSLCQEITEEQSVKSDIVFLRSRNRQRKAIDLINAGLHLLTDEDKLDDHDYPLSSELLLGPNAQYYGRYFIIIGGITVLLSYLIFYYMYS